jgi:hypothetical protein
MSNTALVQIAKGVVLGTGVPLLRDQNASLDTLSVFDLKSDYVTKNYSGINKKFVSLISGAGDAISGSELSKNANGYTLTTLQSGLTLPTAEFDMSNGGTELIADVDFMFYVFVTPDAAAYSGLEGVGGYAYQTTTYNQYGIAINTSSGAPTELRFMGLKGTTYKDVSSSTLAKLTDGLPHLLAVHCKGTSATTLNVTGYVDGIIAGAMSSTMTVGTTMPYPPNGNPAAVPQLGLLDGFAHFAGDLHKVGIIDFTKGNETRTAAEVIADEWHLYQDRFKD